jgi:hypothetical protein
MPRRLARHCLLAARDRDSNPRRLLYLALRLLKVPVVACMMMRHERPMERWELWLRESLANTRKLHEADGRLSFGTDTPFRVRQLLPLGHAEDVHD